MVISVISLNLVGCSSIKSSQIISSNKPKDYIHDNVYVLSISDYKTQIEQDYDRLLSDEQIKDDIKEKSDKVNGYELYTKEAKEFRKTYIKSLKEYNKIIKANKANYAWRREFSTEDKEKIENLEEEYNQKRNAFFDKYREARNDLESKYNKDNE